MTATDSRPQDIDPGRDRATGAAEPGGVSETRGPAGRRGRPRDRVAQAELRQGAVPRPVPAGPDPPAAAARPGDVADGEEFLAKLARVLRDRGRRRADRARRAGSPTRCSSGLAELGAFGMKIDEEYGGLGLSQPALQPGADAGRLGQPGARRAAVGAPVDRRAAAAEAVRHRGAEAAVPAPAAPRGEISRVPAHRAGRRLRPGPAGHHRGRRPRRRLPCSTA